MRQTLGDICTSAYIEGNPKVWKGEMILTEEIIDVFSKYPQPTDIFVDSVLAFVKKHHPDWDPKDGYVVISSVDLPKFIQLDREFHRVFASPILPKGTMYIIREPIKGNRL